MSAWNGSTNNTFSSSVSPIRSDVRSSVQRTLINPSFQNKKQLSIKQSTNRIGRRESQFKTYSSLYDNFFHKRMKFYHRLSALIAAIFTLILSVPFGGRLIFYPIKFLLIWFGFFLLQQARVCTIQTESSKAGNHIEKVVSILSSKKSYILICAFMINSCIVSSIIFSQSGSSLSCYIETPTKTIKPFLNDNFAFFCFFTLISSVVYSFDFLVSEKFTLHFPIGTFRQEPIEYLKALPHLRIIILSLLKTIVLSLISPLVYHIFFRNLFFKFFLKPLVIFLDLNKQLPRSDFNIFTLSTILIYLWISFLSLDILNECFNAYAMVGCLVVQKPISHYSETPIQTLISGLKDTKNQLVRLTAYQELTYLSTSSDFKDRESFYRADNWSLILGEYYFVLINAAKSARLGLPKIEKNDVFRNEKLEKLKKQASIFGNMSNYENNLDFDFEFEIKDGKFKRTSEKDEDNGDVTVIKQGNEAIFKNPDEREKIKSFESQYDVLLTSSHDYLNKLTKKMEVVFKEYFKYDPTKENKDSNSIKYQLYILFKDLSKFANHLIFGTIEEQANKRVPNKELVGFAIISLTEMMIRSKTEDKNNSVQGTLVECLTLLTKVYKGTSEFINSPPAEIDENHPNSIMIVNELSLSYFFKLVIYYNNVLNDLLLPPEVFRLAKWCTDMALEQQKEQKLRTDIIQ